jgi:hypothetical protein
LDDPVADISDFRSTLITVQKGNPIALRLTPGYLNGTFPGF